MTAETLRRAAALMRERAEAATPGTWDPQDWDDTHVVISDPDQDPIADRIADEDDALHIASWHPAVALAVAVLLDKEAEAIESGNWRPCAYDALAVARVYLCEAAS